MMNKHSIATLSFIIFSILIFNQATAQQNLVQAYIITNKGDTTRGLMDYRKWDANPKEIYFQANDREYRYTPFDIRAFEVDHKKYISAYIEEETSPDKTGSLEPYAGLNLKRDSVFLQTIVSGPKSLYYYKGGKAKDNFYIKQDGDFHLLIYKRYLKEVNGKTVVGENRKFIGQLILYLQECPDIQSTLNNTKYTEKSLGNVFRDYYRCLGSDAMVHKQPNNIALYFGPVAGATITKLKFSGSRPYVSEVDFPSSTDIAAGIFLDLILNEEKQNWSIYSELLYTSYHTEAQYDEISSEESYTITNTSISYAYLNLNNLLRYRFHLNEELAIFANVGLSNGFALSNTNRRLIETKLFNHEHSETEVAIPDPRMWELAWIGGIGLEYKNLGLQLRYEAGNGMSALNTLKSTTSSLGIYFSWQF